MYLFASVFKKIIVFIYFWLCWVFVANAGFSLVEVSRGYSLTVVHRLLIVVASFVVEHRLYRAKGLRSCGSQVLEHSLSGCGAQALLLHSGASSQIRDQTGVSCIGRWILYH